MLKIVGGAAGGLIVGGAIGYLAKPSETATTTVTNTVTKTETTTATGTTTTTTTPTTTTPTTTSPADQYTLAARECAAWVGNETPLTQAQLIQELEFFAKASAPYRGKTVLIMYEAIPPAEWEEKNLGPWFEKITGIKIKWESMSNFETILKSIEDQKTQGGIFDAIGSDQDMNGFYTWYKSGLDMTEFMKAHPELVPPYFDLEDFYARATYSDWRNGHLMALLAYNAPHGTVYRKDWFTDPAEKAAFKAKYGYDLKTPMEYYMDAQKSGKIDDDWTTDKARDCMEFFTRPEKNMYGTVTGLRAGDHMGWWTGDGFDDVFQLASPAPAGKDPIECTGFEPNTTPWGMHIEKNVYYGFSKANGGTLNGDAGVAMYDYWFKTIPKYAPDKVWQMDAVEAHTGFFTDGNYALFFPHYCWFTSTGQGPDSKIPGKFEYGPIPVAKQFYQKGKPRGYIDPSGWVISNYSKNKEIAFLFCTFMVSKAFDLKKSLANGVPIRWSTIQHPLFAAKDKDLAGLVTLMKTQMKEQTGTDARMVIYPLILPIAADAGARAAQQGLPPKEAADLQAGEMDKWLVDNGWYKKDLS